VQYRRWTDNDVAELRRLASRYPAPEVAAKLGRRLLDTTMKAHQLRISLIIKSSRESRDSGPEPGAGGTSLKG
jgi:hypothetical protein